MADAKGALFLSFLYLLPHWEMDIERYHTLTLPERLGFWSVGPRRSILTMKDGVSYDAFTFVGNAFDVAGLLLCNTRNDRIVSDMPQLNPRLLGSYWTLLVVGSHSSRRIPQGRHLTNSIADKQADDDGNWTLVYLLATIRYLLLWPFVSRVMAGRWHSASSFCNWVMKVISLIFVSLQVCLDVWMDRIH